MSELQANRIAAGSRVQAQPLPLAPILFGVLFASGLALIAVTPIPAMSDYLNHLARMYLIAADRAGQASPYYEVKWAFYPDLAMDLTAPWLGRWIGVETASRLFVLAAQFLIVSGAVAIEIAVKKRFEYAGFIALLFFSSFPLAWGFVNFLFGLGLALWGVAAWIALREKKPAPARFAVHLAFFLGLAVCHLFALGIYGFAIGLHDIWRAARVRPPFAAFLLDMALLAAPAAAAGVAFAIMGGAVGAQGSLWGLSSKQIWPFLAINGYSKLISAVCALILAALAWRLKRANGLRFESSGLWQAAGFFALYLAMPQILFRTALVDVRIVVAAALIVPGFLSLHFPDDKFRRMAAIAVLTMIAVNLACMALVWSGYRSDYREIIASFLHLPKGSRILVAKFEPPAARTLNWRPEADDLLPLYHAPALAAHYADALVSTMMAVRGKQPLASRPAFERLNTHDDPPATIDELKAAATGGAEAQGEDEYLRHWTQDFDYVYYIGWPIANPMPDRFERVESRRRFTLYRIRKP